MESEIAEGNNEREALPSVNSSDPEGRKLARRKRIEARLEAAKRAEEIAAGVYIEPPQEQSLVDETIETSEDTLRYLYTEGKELISNIIIASDAKEVQRRETVEKDKTERLQKLQEESAIALLKLDEISNKWENILNINGPLELFQNMNEQKAKCLDLIQQKNDLIKSFQLELKLADEKFMKGRKAMYEELALLTRRIDEQVLLMRKAYRVELNQIEESVEKTRTEVMEKHQKTWQALYNQREKDETANMSKKFELVDSFHEEFHKLHKEHEERYRATRIQLETDIQILEQELEQVKALCLLNSEKLDYNYQVLKKREQENLYIKNHQKRRLNKLQDMVNTLKKKIDEKSLSVEEDYKRLTKDVKRFYDNVLETEKKAELFSEANDDKFNEIWKMKDEEAKDLVEKIFSVDMIIHEQILGDDWSPPATINFSKNDLPSYKTALAVVRDFTKQRKGRKQEIPPTGRNLREDDPSPEVLQGQKRLLCHILSLVSDHSGFLMEEKLDELLGPYSEDEKTFVRLDNVFVAIGIKKEKDIETMMKIFMPYTVCLVCEREAEPEMGAGRELSEPHRAHSNSRQTSILQIRELEEKVSKLRMQARAGSADYQDSSGRRNASSDDRKTGGGALDSSREPEKESPQVEKNSGELPVGRRSHSVSSWDTQMTGWKGKAACDITHPLHIKKLNVLKALRDFVSFYHTGRFKVMLGIEEKLSPKRFTVSRMLSEEDIICYWEKYREAVPTKLEHVWDGVFLALKRYLSVLQERHNLNKKAKVLIRQNHDLKRLVALYKASDSCKPFKLPEVSSVPDEPIDSGALANILSKLIL